MDKNVHKIRILFLLAVFFSGIFNLTDLIAVAYMPIGDAMTIILCGAIPTVILAAIFLDERLRLFKIICSVFVVCLLSSVSTFSFDGSFISTVNEDALSGEDVAEVVFVLSIM